MVSITVRLMPWMLQEIDHFIKKGLFHTRSEFVQYAIRNTLKELGERGWNELLGG